jgi:hypothetical protein
VAKINVGRVIQGGLLAGLVINLICIFDMGVLLNRKLMEGQAAGHFLKEPRFAFAPAWMLVMFLAGIALVWLYAAVRPRLGPGPGTALTLGILVGFLSGLPDNMAAAAWSLTGRFLPLMWMIERVVSFGLGTLVGAWWYKEPDA